MRPAHSLAAPPSRHDRSPSNAAPPVHPRHREDGLRHGRDRPGPGLAQPPAKALPAGAIRQGAKQRDGLSSACIRCGLCVRDCPYDILQLATPAQQVATGTPYLWRAASPCEMCEDIPCVKACPTGRWIMA